MIFADHQSNPQVGATEAERLINQEKVVALMGCYQSNVTATASQVAERYQIPFLNDSSSSPTLTQRGFKWFFRVSPHDGLFIANSFEFLRDLQKKKGFKIKTIGLLSANNLAGSDAAKLENKLATEQGYTVVKSISYPVRSTQLTSEVESLKAANPQLIMEHSYAPDAILAMKTYKELNFLPEMILANDAGFSDTDYVKTLGKDGDYIISRDTWALDLANRNPLIKQVNDLFYARYKINFTGNSSRAFTGLMVLADALNRAKSTNPTAIRKALAETNIPPDKLIMPWKGVRFDETGQNVLASGIVVQVIGGKYVTIWPFDRASHDVIWPMPRWNQRH